MSDHQAFLEERKETIKQLGGHSQLKKSGVEFLIESSRHRYSYHFDWLGLPIIQFPQDMVAIQEVIWKTSPDIIVECGVARGGSLLLSASILQLLNGRGKVIGIDIDIREHNRIAIEQHPLSHRIKLIEGSSTDQATLKEVQDCFHPQDKVMVILDSNHTYDHVREELAFYSPLVTKGCYLIIMDTIIEEMPEDFFPDRPWGKESNPKKAVQDFLHTTSRFEVDQMIEDKLLISVAPQGYLKCLK